jgi:type IV pilus assembly protein PilV
MKNIADKRARTQGGVALLEVLVSILLFSLGILGLIGLQARAISTSIDSEDRNRAALLANEVASSMWMNRSATVPAGVLTAWQTRVGAATEGGLPGGLGSVTPVAGVPNSADIRITWRPPSRPTSEPDSVLTTRVTINLP